MGYLIAKIVIEQNASSINNIISAFEDAITSGSVSSHNDLSGIQGGSAAEYYHLTGAQFQANIDRSLIWITDANYKIAGINELSGSATFQVGTVWRDKTGTISTSTYDPVDDQTLVLISGGGSTYGLDDGSLVNVSETLHYINEVINLTSFYIEGNYTFSGETWAAKQAPYVDVSGSTEEERGYSWSTDGDWKYSQFITHNTNDSELCMVSRTNLLGFLQCLKDNGNLYQQGNMILGTDTMDDLTGYQLPENHVAVNGPSAEGKGFILADEGVPQWDMSIYNGELGKYLYVGYNYKNNENMLTGSETGLTGINKQGNVMNVGLTNANHIGSGLNDEIGRA
jgi:hypothetical protein